MKSVFVLVICAIIVVSHADDALKAELTEYTKSCAEKTNFSEEGIKKLHAKDLSLTENVQCFQKCFFESSGIVNENGLNGDRLFEIATAFEKDVSKTKANFQKCSALYKADTYDCNAAWDIFTCFHE